MATNSVSPKKITIKDVARACGVSVATVSYVINGTRVLKSDTRERVLKMMDEMNYHPNAVARGLSSKRVHTLGLHCGVLQADEFITNPYAAGILSGVLECASRSGFDVTLFTNRWQDKQSSAPALQDGRTDGMIALAPQITCDMVESIASLGIPLVTIAAAAQAHIPMVDVDSFAGAKMSAQHLISLGHTRIAALLGNEDLSSFAPRRAGFCAALSEANLEVKPRWIMASHFDGSLAAEQTHLLLQGNERPTAICAGNDNIALAIMDTATKAGLQVPQQLSVVGFDDLPFASMVTPSLTTIRQPLRAIGACAANLLIDRIQGHYSEDDERPHLLSPELIVRGSTAPAADSIALAATTFAH